MAEGVIIPLQATLGIEKKSENRGPGWGQPMTCMETMIDKTAIGMHIGYTTTVHHRMRYQEQYPIVRATSPEAPNDLPDALSDHPEALGDIAVAPGDILRPQVTSLRPHETSLRP